MKNPKVGERVRVYGVNTQDGEINGSVSDIDHNGWLMVLYDCPGTTARTHHPKQCRRLKPKAKERIWVPQSQLDEMDEDESKILEEAAISRNPCAEDDVPFVREKVKK
jgi:hypothetical protein